MNLIGIVSVSPKYSHNYYLLDTLREGNVSTLFNKLNVLFICVIEYLMGFNKTAIKGTPDNYGSRLGCHWFAESPQYTLFFSSVTHPHKICVYSVLEHINTFSTQLFSPYVGRNLWICDIHGSACAIDGSIVCAEIHGYLRNLWIMRRMPIMSL